MMAPAQGVYQAPMMPAMMPPPPPQLTPAQQMALQLGTKVREAKDVIASFQDPVVPQQLLARVEGLDHIKSLVSFLDPGATIDDDAATLISDLLSRTAESMQDFANGVAKTRAALAWEAEKERQISAAASGAAAVATPAREPVPTVEPGDYALYVREVMPAVAAVLPATATSHAAPAVPVPAPPSLAQKQHAAAQAQLAAQAAAAAAAAMTAAASAAAASKKRLAGDRDDAGGSKRGRGRPKKNAY